LINEKQNSQLTFQDKTKQFGMITQLNTVSCYYVFSLHREEKKKKRRKTEELKRKEEEEKKTTTVKSRKKTIYKTRNLCHVEFVWIYSINNSLTFSIPLIASG
jgi:hypothetical protein